MILSKRAVLKGLAGGTATALVFGGATARAQGKPKRGGSLRFSFWLEPTTLDAHAAMGGGDHYYLRSMHDNLIALDRSGNPDPTRSLAERWEISTNPHSLTFYLRDNVKFHDGATFDAAAVKFNIDRILNPKTKAAAFSIFKIIKSIDVLNERTVRFNLDGPWAAGLRQLAGPSTVMISPLAAAKSGEDYAWKPVGTGPFKLAEVVPGSYVRVVRNEEYWLKDHDGSQLPYLDEVTFKVIKDDAVSAAALRSGEIDLAYAPASEVEAFKKDERFHVEKFEGSGVSFLLMFNTSLKPADNVHLRRAIGHAVRSEDINRAAFFDVATVARSAIWPPASWIYSESKTKPEFDLAKAKEELAAGGMPNGYEIDVILWNGAGLPQAAQVFQAQLAQVGIKVNLQVVTVAAANEAFFRGNKVPAYITSWSYFPEPDRDVQNMLKTGGFYNAGGKGSGEVDALIAEGAATYDEDRRKAIYRQLGEIMVGEAYDLPLLYRNYYATAPKKVQNLATVFDSSAILNLRDVWFA